MNRKYLFAAIMSAVFLCAFAAAGFRVLRQNPRYAQKRACREVETMQQEKVLRDGDLIFQTSLSGQSRAIQEATGSKYSHCGIIYRDGCDYFVYEAVQPVKSTPLAQWIARGKGGHYVVKRLAGADSLLTERNIAAMRREAARFAGRDYDLTFGWSDDRLYCSELIWKIYDRALGIRLGNLQRLGDFDLSAPAVREKLAERYGAAPPSTNRSSPPLSSSIPPSSSASPAGDMPRITATSCRTANDRHRKTAIVPIRQEHKHFQTEKKIIFRALSFQRTRRLTADDSGTTSYPQPSAQFRPTGAHDILHDTQGSSPRFAPHVASSSDNAATISTDKIHSRTVFHYRPLPTKKTRETLWISLVK